MSNQTDKCCYVCLCPDDYAEYSAWRGDCPGSPMHALVIVRGYAAPPTLAYLSPHQIEQLARAVFPYPEMATENFLRANEMDADHDTEIDFLRLQGLAERSWARAGYARLRSVELADDTPFRKPSHCPSDPSYLPDDTPFQEREQGRFRSGDLGSETL